MEKLVLLSLLSFGCVRSDIIKNTGFIIQVNKSGLRDVDCRDVIKSSVTIDAIGACDAGGWCGVTFGEESGSFTDGFLVRYPVLGERLWDLKVRTCAFPPETWERMKQDELKR